MEAEKKAMELVDKFDETLTYLESKQKAKESALIAVDEILKANKVWYEDTIPYKYWNDVKKEIEKL